jgi:hypothetical protein
MTVIKYYFFEMLVENQWIRQPDSGITKESSHLGCVMACFYWRECTTVNVLRERGVYVCQISRKKAVCMEKTEVKPRNGAHMFQVTVSFENVTEYM